MFPSSNSKLILLATMQVLAFTVLTQSITGSNSTGIVVDNISYGGSGCPQGSLSFVYTISDTRGVAVFNGYTSSRGPNISIIESRKNCDINVDIQYPNGVQYSPVSVSYSGFANMDDGVQGLHKTTYYFTGSSEQVSTNHKFVGPTSTAYRYEEVIDQTGTVIWSPCNSSASLNVNNQIRLTEDTNSTGKGVLYDSGIVDLNLQWRSC